MDPQMSTVISIFGALISLVALVSGIVARAHSVSRETIRDLQDEVAVLKSEVKELKRRLENSQEQERALTAENLDLRHREERLQQRVSVLEGAK